MYCYASGLVNAILCLAPEGVALEAILDPERRFEGTMDAVCVAQQMLAEATGLVGVDETDFVTLEDME